MCKRNIKYFLAAPVLVLAVLLAPHIVMAAAVNGTFVDTAGGPNPDNITPDSITLVHEHGGETAGNWTDNDTLDIEYYYRIGNNAIFDLEVEITNTSDHTMFDTVLIFEQDAFNDWTLVLTDNTWDGEVNGNSAYWFGDIASQGSSLLYIDVRDEEQDFSPLNLAYDSPGLESPGFNPFSNVSIAHAAAVIPEPISSTLFVVGGATLGFRRFRKQRSNS